MPYFIDVHKHIYSMFIMYLCNCQLVASTIYILIYTYIYVYLLTFTYIKLTYLYMEIKQNLSGKLYFSLCTYYYLYLRSIPTNPAGKLEMYIKLPHLATFTSFFYSI